METLLINTQTSSFDSEPYSRQMLLKTDLNFQPYWSGEYIWQEWSPQEIAKIPEEWMEL